LSSKESRKREGGKWPDRKSSLRQKEKSKKQKTTRMRKGVWMARQKGKKGRKIKERDSQKLLKGKFLEKTGKKKKV